MKIRIKADGHNIRLWLPTSILKSKLACNIINNAILNSVTKQREKKETPFNDAVLQNQAEYNTPLTREQVTEMYATLVRVIKTCGHFDIVKIESAKGEKVLISV